MDCVAASCSSIGLEYYSANMDTYILLIKG
jgi:hypothetical protein